MGRTEKMAEQHDIIITNEYKNLSMNDEILKILVNLLNNFEEAVKQAKEEAAAIIQKAVEKKASNYVDFGFPKPLKKGAGFEQFLLRVLEAERVKCPEFAYQVRRNEQGEIVAVEIRGPKDAFNHALRTCAWIRGKLLAQNSRKGGAN
jgi:hypothetical protein